ncbi:Protein of unknown function [Pyronema omphalodes CBS 100304]|uniref:Uncharacterized protein n=1 Tax=Pyronema omphalodes (strain CBS 100304) TaxID=1076935 RepID=U4LRP7_PYROM|nr:Protein of unknown function [Pyronema omphalodes CBS 100304]
MTSRAQTRLRYDKHN